MFSGYYLVLCILKAASGVSAIFKFKVSGYPKQHSDLTGDAGSLIHFSVNIFSFPLFPDLCVLSQALWFVPLPGSAVTFLSWESSGCAHKDSFPARGGSLHLCLGLFPTPHSSVVSPSCVLISLALHCVLKLSVFTLKSMIYRHLSQIWHSAVCHRVQMS